MKRIYKLLFAVGMLTTVVYTPAPAQKPVLAGFVFANAVGVDGRADVTANGRKLTRQGLEQGMATSGLGMPIGNYEVQVTAPGCEPAKASIQVQVGATPVLVAFVEHVSDPRTNAVKHFVRLRQYPAVPQENNYLFNIVSVDPTVRVTAT